MAIDFPSSPSVNDSHTSSGKTWIWTGDYWKLYGTQIQGINLEISDTAPTPATQGDMWFESDTGRTFTYYDGAWVELGSTASITSFLTDADADTRVHVEESADEDVIRFDTAGTEKAFIDGTGLTVSGDLDVTGTIAGGSTTFPTTLDSGTMPAIEALQAKVGVDGSAVTTSIDYKVSTLEGQVDNLVEVQTAEQTASHTLALADGGTVVEMNVASANDLTVPPNSSVAFPVGTQITVLQTGAGQTTLVAGSGVTINSADGNLKITGQWSAATLLKRATDTWVAIGSLSA
jgi:hypothetical protein